jgi:hypothetical protein
MGSHMRTVTGSWIRFACFSVILSASLAACGGGSSGTTASEQSSGQPPAAPAPAPTPNPTPAPTPAPAPANAAPTISGTATPTAVTGQAWSFQPSAADANQDTVTFTIANKPAWAAFNATTGLLSGTPAAANVGTYSGIEIAATDGNSVAALPAFAITVTAAPAATAVSLAWTPPTQNDDGSTLTDLSGYKIHYGTTSKSYSQSIPLTNAAGLTRYELDSLPKGTIYIAMTAVNASGSESDFSTEVAVTLN